MAIKTKINGVWRDSTPQAVRVGGMWRSINSTSIKIDGEWKSLIDPELYANYLMAQSPEIYLKLDETSGTDIIDASGNWGPGLYYSSTQPIKGTTAQSFIRPGNTCVSIKTGGPNYGRFPTGFVNTVFSQVPVSGSIIFDFCYRFLGATDGKAMASWGPASSCFSIERYTNAWRFTVRSNAVQSLIVQSNILISDTNWHHISCVYNNKSGYIYVDGVLEASASLSTLSETIRYSSDEVWLGRYTNTGNPLTDIDIDEIAVFINNDWISPLANKDWYNYL
jgi:hypothetical protein